MLKMALLDWAINEKCCSVDGGRGICSLFPSPPRGIWQLKNPHPQAFAIQGKKILMPGGQPGAGLGAAGIDWCIARSPLESNKAWATHRSNSVLDSKFATNIPVTFTWESLSGTIFVLHILKNTLVARNRIFLNESSLKVTYRVNQGPFVQTTDSG